MEDKTTAFLNMVMDRLQTLEGRCDEQQGEIDALKSERSEIRSKLLMDLHVVPCFYVQFSDSLIIAWEIGSPPRLIIPSTGPTESRTKSQQMDDQHLQATMYYGRKYVVVQKSHSENAHFVVGRHGQRTSVAEFFEKINADVKREGCSQCGERVYAMISSGNFLTLKS